MDSARLRRFLLASGSLHFRPLHTFYQNKNHEYKATWQESMFRSSTRSRPASCLISLASRFLTSLSLPFSPLLACSPCVARATPPYPRILAPPEKAHQLEPPGLPAQASRNRFSISLVMPPASLKCDLQLLCSSKIPNLVLTQSFEEPRLAETSSVVHAQAHTPTL